MRGFYAISCHLRKYEIRIGSKVGSVRKFLTHFQSSETFSQRWLCIREFFDPDTGVLLASPFIFLSLLLPWLVVIDTRTPSSIRNSFSPCMEFSQLENSISSLSYIFIRYKNIPVSDRGLPQRSRCFLSLASNQDPSSYGLLLRREPFVGLRRIRQIDSVYTVDRDRADSPR